ncbi:MAG: CARDB domain-containing protein, partial [Haloarculaceae archaeon]
GTEPVIARIRGAGPDSEAATAITLSFCVSLAAVAVGVPIVAGPALAQTGSVNVQDTIYADTDPITVEIPQLETELAWLVVENLDNGDSGVYTTTVSSWKQQTKQVDLASIGPSSPGDRIQARVYDTDFEEEELGRDTSQVRAREPPNFEVVMDSTNSPVTVGQSLDVRATVTNTGEQSASQEIGLVVGARQRDSTSLTLARDEWATVKLSWQTRSGHAGGYTAVVASDDSAASRSVRVEEPPAPANFDVSIESTTSPVTEGQTLDVTATVTNTGDKSDSQDIDLGIGGSHVDSTALALDPGEKTTVTLSWETASGDVGDHESTVTSDDTTARGTVLVEPETTTPTTTTTTTTTPTTTVETTTRQTDVPPDQPQVDLRIDSTSSPVAAGSPLDVEVTITNRGDGETTDEVVLSLGGDREDSRSISLGGGESRTLTLTWQTGSGDAGEYTAVVASSSETAEDSVVVRESDGGGFDVEIESTTAPESEGDPLSVTARISNTGPTTDTQVVKMAVNGDERASNRLSLAPGDNQRVSFSYDPSSDGSKPTIEVWSEDDEDRSVVETSTSGGGNPLTDPLLVGLFLLLFGAVAGGYMYVRRRQLNGEGSE